MTERQSISIRTELRMLGLLYRSLLCLIGAAGVIAAVLFCGIGKWMPHFHSIAASLTWNSNVLTANADHTVAPSLLLNTVKKIDEPTVQSNEADATQTQPLAIATRDLRATQPLTLRNETSYMPDITALLSVATAQIAADETTPTVLIIHTHATEAYATGSHYSTETSFRSTDPQENMIAVGNVIAEVLCERGFHVIHCTEQHDAVSFNAAYEYSAASVRRALQEHPEISYILDIHRDAIEDSGGNVVRCAAEWNGQSYAQMMIVVGTDERGAQHPFWKKNLSFALALQSRLCDTYPGLMRQINLRGAAFNQQYCDGYLLLEIGSSGNTLQEAKASARLFAAVYADVIDPNPSTF